MPNKFSELSNASFGIEVELTNVDYITLYHQLLTTFRENNISAQFNAIQQYFHSSGHTFDLKTDSSCGYELASPRMRWGSSEFCTFATLVARLQELQVSRGSSLTDHRCSVHVHHDIIHLTYTQLRKLVQLWYTFEPLAFSLTEPDRLSSAYCRPLRSCGSMNANTRGYRTIMRMAHSLGRRTALNLVDYPRRQAVEIRIFHGTLDFTQITQWTKWTQLLIMLATRRIRLNSLNRCINEQPHIQREHFGRLLTNFFEMDVVRDTIEWMEQQQERLHTPIPAWMLQAPDLTRPSRRQSTRRVHEDDLIFGSINDYFELTSTQTEQIIYWDPYRGVVSSDYARTGDE